MDLEKPILDHINSFSVHQPVNVHIVNERTLKTLAALGFDFVAVGAENKRTNRILPP